VGDAIRRASATEIWPLIHEQRITLRASDVAWSAGAGPEVTGPLASIILAITGRQSALDDLSGKGLDTLRARA
jgi:hypothetical protein